jgi:hypothetical protein
VGAGQAAGGPGAQRTWEARVAAAEEPIQRRLHVREGEGQHVPQQTGMRRRAARRPRHSVRAAIPPQEGLVRKGRADDVEEHALAHVGDRALHCLPQHLCSLALVSLVLGRLGVEGFPRFVRLAPGRVDVDHVGARGADGGVDEGGDEEGAKVLRVLQRAGPVLHDQVRAVPAQVGQVQALSVDGYK